MPLVEHVEELRYEISGLREMVSVSPKAVLQRQDNFLALRCELSALQSADDANVSALQDEDTALRGALPVSQKGTLEVWR